MLTPPAATKEQSADGHRLRIRSDWVDRLLSAGSFLAPDLVRESVLLKQTGSRRVERFLLSTGDSVVVKRYPPRRGLEGWVTALPWSLATDHEARNGLAMEAAGLPVAETLAAGERRLGIGREGILVTRFVEAAEDLHAVVHGRGLRGEERRAVTRALGRLWRRLHDAGFRHDDPHLGNFLLLSTSEEEPLRLVDLRRVEQRGAPDEAARQQSLVRLYESFGVLGSASDRHRFLAAYLEDASRATRQAWARAIEARSVDFLAHFRWRRSRAALKTNRGFERLRRGSLQWHRRRSEEDPWLDSWLEDPDRMMQGATEVLKESRSSKVVAWPEWVVKRDNLKHWRRRVQERLTAGRTQRALRLSWYLEMAGFGTPRIALAGERRALGCVVAGYLVMRRIPGARRVHDAVRDAESAERPRLLERIARLVADLHRCHLVHRDLKAGNVLQDADGNLQLVDFDGLRFVRRPRPERQLRDLERLFRDLKRRSEFTPQEELAFREAYAAWRWRGSVESRPENPAGSP